MTVPSDLARLVGRTIRVETDGAMFTSQVVAVGTRGATLNVGGRMRTITPTDRVRVELPDSS